MITIEIPDTPAVRGILHTLREPLLIIADGADTPAAEAVAAEEVVAAINEALDFNAEVDP